MSNNTYIVPFPKRKSRREGRRVQGNLIISSTPSALALLYLLNANDKNLDRYRELPYFPKDNQLEQYLMMKFHSVSLDTVAREYSAVKSQGENPGWGVENLTAWKISLSTFSGGVAKHKKEIQEFLTVLIESGFQVYFYLSYNANEYEIYRSVEGKLVLANTESPWIKPLNKG
jgi:hypothetical protein